jgi:geranylgeranyl diphosphate synthase type I
MMTPVALDPFCLTTLETFENQLMSYVTGQFSNDLSGCADMVSYHLGWSGERSGPEARGKRIRPLIVLLTCQAACGRFDPAWYAAMAVELLHNYSLVHDDIEDNSPTRRGRPTLWVRYGISQAINTGDLIFSLAHLALQQMSEGSAPQQFKLAEKVFADANIQLTEGQYLDISFETRQQVTLAEYEKMITGKTANLFGACAQLGAICAGASDSCIQAWYDFGLNLGLAFQIKDDILGIWGDERRTGKSAAIDLISRKKTFPILFGLEHSPEFLALWKDQPLNTETVSSAAKLLEKNGARRDAESRADELTRRAMASLVNAVPDPDKASQLVNLTHFLLDRQA